uniref:Palmitoyltransferase n=1 Tax=Nakaseomyces delphensis TaxID=51657 RepID=A7WPG7_NAKDE|nr:palmitoyltransferase [Nakaseomyces delphensis]
MAFVDWRVRNRYWTAYIVPLIVLGIIGYGTWAYAHKLCYNQIYRELGHRSTCIGLICICCILDVLLIIIWCETVMVGPGKLPRVPPYMIIEAGSTQDTTIAPQTYVSDPNGYPVWCSSCRSLKVGRTRHSSRNGYCVPRFDHYCLWIGGAVGYSNYRLFLLFTFYFAVLLTIVWITICCYIREIVTVHHRRLNGNLVALLVITGIGWILTWGLFVSYVYYMSQNMTSIEVMEYKKRKKTPELAMQRFVCHYDPETELRYVVKIGNEYKQGSLYKKRGVFANIAEFMGGNWPLWLVPLPRTTSYGKKEGRGRLEATLTSPYSETFGPYALEYIQMKIASGDYIHAFSPAKEEEIDI